MWQYFGNKGEIAELYPKPKFKKIIEPFAGSARYSLLHFESDVLLVDKYNVVVDIWRWLQQCSREDILKLPRLRQGERLSDYSFDCKEARDLLGFLIGSNVPSPKKQATGIVAHRKNHINYQLVSIANNLFKIKHWEIRLGDYSDIQNVEATWYIDPPYQVKGGDGYVYGNKDIDYSRLGEWCKSREGQVIVCESLPADWLPFRGLKRKSNGMRGTWTMEAIWSNYPTDYDIEQLHLPLE